MCGIAGILYFDRQRPVDREVLLAMCRALRHRGPDDHGTFTNASVGLASTRLSILDLARGHMPLSNEDGTVWIAYNGEVYNFLELRERLERSGHYFATRGDTEVIVHLYEEEQENFAAQLEGMFAVAIWDARKRQLVLARDHVGIKPLYYSLLPDRLVFASEMKALCVERTDASVDRTALHDYLSLNYVPGPRTILSGVRKLQPGHILIASAETGKAETRRYWDFPLISPAPAEKRTVEELETELTTALRSAIRRTLISDVPLGAFLSGGIDSSLVVALMSEVSNRPVRTFSVGFEEDSYSELPYARSVAQRYHTEHNEIVLRPQAQDLISSVVEFFDEPFADNSALGVFAVSQLARREVKVVLSGDGGDEVFGGYYTYQADKLANLYRRLPKVLRDRLLPAMVELLPTSLEKASFDFKLKRFVQGGSLPPLAAHYSWKAYLNEEMKFELYGDGAQGNGFHHELRPTVELLQSHYDAYPTADLLNRLIYVDSKIQLADDMLTKVDRMSMAHSLEVRVPLLDRQLIDFMTGLSSRHKVRGLTLKHLLKRVARKLLPSRIIDRPKAGFTVPISKWVATDLRDLAREQLSESRLRSQGFFEPKQVKRLLDLHGSGRRDFGRSIWTLLVFGLWYDRQFQRSYL